MNNVTTNETLQASATAPGLLAHGELDPARSAGDGFDAEVDAEVRKAIPEHFTIDSEERANWLVRKLISARQYAVHVKEWAEQEQRRAEREEQTLFFLFGRQLQSWATQEIERFHGRRKSISMPAGTLGFRKVATALRVDDEEQVLNWAKTNCRAAVVITEKLSRSELKAHFEATGEVPPQGAHVEESRDAFFIRA